MFTGIIKNKVLAKKVQSTRTDLTFKVDLSSMMLLNAKIGDSIAFDGVCLTIAKIDESQYAYFELMNETLERTTFKNLLNEQFLNYEESITLQDKLDGHLVYGEVDCIGTISKIETVGDSQIYTITYPKYYADFVIEKGRIAIDGASLSIINASCDGVFSVALIPHTLKILTLTNKKVNNDVNLEFDIYVKVVNKKRTTNVV